MVRARGEVEVESVEDGEERRPSMTCEGGDPEEAAASQGRERGDGEQTPEWREARQDWRKASPGRQTGNGGRGAPVGGATTPRSADSVREGRAWWARANGGWARGGLAGVGRIGGCWDRGGGRRRVARLWTLITVRAQILEALLSVVVQFITDLIILVLI
jgi:hypothetical protein